MRAYLGTSISSLNQNKLNGLLAEVAFRQRVQDLGFTGRISPGGWILRKERQDFGHHTVVLFPETVQPATDYPVGRAMPQPPHNLHTVCATFHQSGIHAFFCAPAIAMDDDAAAVSWQVTQLGVPAPQAAAPLAESFRLQFVARERPYNFCRYHTDAEPIPANAVPEEFSKEHLRVAFCNHFFAEISDVDGIFWGEQFTYPVEIKEKTAFPDDPDIGPWFGLDVGPFVKLAFYAAKRGNLHSLFVVREIDNEQDRNLISWWFITFETLAQFASWNQRGGGRGMGGGRSAVIRIPRAEFTELTAENLGRL